MLRTRTHTIHTTFSQHKVLTSLIFQKSILFPIAAACPIPAGVFTPVFVLGASLGRLFGLVFRFPKTSEEESDFFWALPQNLDLGPSALIGEMSRNNPSGRDEDGAVLSTTGSKNLESDGAGAGSFQKTLQSYFDSVDAAAQGWFGTQNTGDPGVPATSSEMKQARRTTPPEDSFTQSPPVMQKGSFSRGLRNSEPRKNLSCLAVHQTVLTNTFLASQVSRPRHICTG